MGFAWSMGSGVLRMLAHRTGLFTRGLHSVLAHLRRALGEPFSSPGEVERAECSYYISYLQEGMIVFDVGAYVGELTLLFSHFVREGGQVHAFEANGASFERLKTICQAAGHPNIVLNRIAMAEKEGEAELVLYDEEHRSWSSLAERPLERYGIHVQSVGRERVVTTTVDNYCREHDIARIDLLKIDVEGAEYQVLLGARQMLQARQVRCCVFEFGQTTFDMGNDPEEIEDYLAGYGYRLRNVVRGDPVISRCVSRETARYSMYVAVPG